MVAAENRAILVLENNMGIKSWAREARVVAIVKHTQYAVMLILWSSYDSFSIVYN
jgi:hypothetical protein